MNSYDLFLQNRQVADEAHAAMGDKYKQQANALSSSFDSSGLSARQRAAALTTLGQQAGQIGVDLGVNAGGIEGLSKRQGLAASMGALGAQQDMSNFNVRRQQDENTALFNAEKERLGLRMYNGGTSFVRGLWDRATGETARRQAAADTQAAQLAQAADAERAAMAQAAAQRMGLGAARIAPVEAPANTARTTTPSYTPVLSDGFGQRALDRRMQGFANGEENVQPVGSFANPRRDTSLDMTIKNGIATPTQNVAPAPVTQSSSSFTPAGMTRNVGGFRGYNAQGQAYTNTDMANSNFVPTGGTPRNFGSNPVDISDAELGAAKTGARVISGVRPVGPNTGLTQRNITGDVGGNVTPFIQERVYNQVHTRPDGTKAVTLGRSASGGMPELRVNFGTSDGTNSDSTKYGGYIRPDGSTHTWRRGESDIDAELRKDALNVNNYKRGTARVPGPNVDRDVVPAVLTPGEAVLNKGAAQAMGRDKIARLNAKHAGGKKSGLRGGALHAAAGEPFVKDPNKNPYIPNTGAWHKWENDNNTPNAQGNIYFPDKPKTDAELMSTGQLSTGKIGGPAYVRNPESELVKQIPTTPPVTYNNPNYRGAPQTPAVATPSVGELYAQAKEADNTRFYPRNRPAEMSPQQRFMNTFGQGERDTGMNGASADANFNRTLVQGRDASNTLGGGRFTPAHGAAQDVADIGGGIAKITLKDGHKLYTNVGVGGVVAPRSNTPFWDTPTAEDKARQDKWTADHIRDVDARLAAQGGVTGAAAAIRIAAADKQQELGLRKQQNDITAQHYKDTAKHQEGELGLRKQQLDATIEANKIAREAQQAQLTRRLEEEAANHWNGLVGQSGYDKDKQVEFSDFVRDHFLGNDSNGKEKRFSSMTPMERETLLPEMKRQYEMWNHIKDHATHGRVSTGNYVPVSTGLMNFNDVNAQAYLGDTPVGPSTASDKTHIGFNEFGRDKFNPLNNMQGMVILRDKKSGNHIMMRKKDYLAGGYAPDLKNMLVGLPDRKDYEAANKLKW